MTTNKTWPHHLAKNFQALLQPLITQGAQISIERLQLVSMSIELGDFAIAPAKLEKNGEVLVVTHVIEIAPQQFAQWQAQFFVRGQKRYFKHGETALNSVMKEIPALQIEDIEKFLRALGQENTALTSLELAQLSGRREVSVPSLLLMVMMLEYACADMHNHTGNKFALKFIRAVFVGDELAIGSSVVDDKNVVVLTAKGKLAVELTA